MAENENTIGNIVPVESADALGIKSLNSPFAQSFYFNEDSIIVLPISSDYLKMMKIIGQNINMDIITQNKSTLFF